MTKFVLFSIHFVIMSYFELISSYAKKLVHYKNLDALALYRLWRSHNKDNYIQSYLLDLYQHMTMLNKIPLLLIPLVLLKLFNVCIIFDIFLVIGIFLEVLAYACSNHLIRVDIGFCMLCVCACWYSVQITGRQWVDLCINQ